MGEPGSGPRYEPAEEERRKLPTAGPARGTAPQRARFPLQSLAGNRAVAGLLTPVQRQSHDHRTGHRAAPVSPEQAADQQAVDDLLTSLGPLRRRGQEMIRYAHDAGIPGRDIRAAVQEGAFDDTPLNRLQAATVYVIGRAAGHPATAAIASGQVRVHVIDTMPAGVNAAYVAVDTPPLVHDTIYVRPSLSVGDLGARSVVIHELQHAEQDRDPAHSVDPGQHPSKARAEWEAFRTQARYIINQLRSLTGAARDGATAQVAASLDRHVGWMLVLEAQRDREQLEPLIAPIFAAAAPPLHRDGEQLDQLLSLEPGALESRAARDMVSDYEAGGMAPESDAPFDGYTGHSAEDVAFRTGRAAPAGAAPHPSP